MYATTKEFLIRFGLNDLTICRRSRTWPKRSASRRRCSIEQTPTEEMLPLEEPEEDFEDDEDEPGESIH